MLLAMALGFLVMLATAHSLCAQTGLIAGELRRVDFVHMSGVMTCQCKQCCRKTMTLSQPWHCIQPSTLLVTRLLPLLEARYVYCRSFLPLQPHMHQAAMYSAALLSHWAHLTDTDTSVGITHADKQARGSVVCSCT